MTFTQLNLHPQIAKAIHACGYDKPTPIQAETIPDILAGKDIVACAQTGTGKTASFVLPALHRLLQNKAGRNPRVLILTPTRELARQITDSVHRYGKFLRFNVVNLVGGMPYRSQLRGLAQPVDIIVATPGRLLDHLENRKVNLSAIEMLVLDEADRMLDMGFIDDVKAIAKATTSTRQTLLFSATINHQLSKVIQTLMHEPVSIDLSHNKITPAQIKQELYFADNLHHKTRLLQHFIDNHSMFKAIIFSATKINADKLAYDLSKQGHAASALHGDLKQSVRNKTIEGLRKGKIQYLVATDVAARGIDISDITHVINYDLPRFSEDYVHRIGRTGRAGKNGIAISFALRNDLRHIQKIERHTGQALPRCTITGLEPSQTDAPFQNKKKKGKKKNAGFKHKRFQRKN